MTYKPRTISIGAKGSEPTDGEIKGRPITACDTSEVAAPEPSHALINRHTWSKMESMFPTPDELQVSNEERALSRLLGLRVYVDETIPDGEMEMRSGRDRVRIINIGKGAE